MSVRRTDTQSERRTGGGSVHRTDVTGVCAAANLTSVVPAGGVRGVDGEPL